MRREAQDWLVPAVCVDFLVRGWFPSPIYLAALEDPHCFNAWFIETID